MIPGLLLVGFVLNGGDAADLREALRDPSRVFSAFQELIEAGFYTKAYNVCLSPSAHQQISPEEFQIALSAVGGVRRLVGSLRVHEVDPSAGRLHVCSPEFGVSRRLGLVRWRSAIWLLDFTREDIEYFRGRILGWFRHQVRRADGWHFAYPPDWSYAPMARHCGRGQ